MASDSRRSEDVDYQAWRLNKSQKDHILEGCVPHRPSSRPEKDASLDNSSYSPHPRLQPADHVSKSQRRQQQKEKAVERSRGQSRQESPQASVERKLNSSLGTIIQDSKAKKSNPRKADPQEDQHRQETNPPSLLTKLPAHPQGSKRFDKGSLKPDPCESRGKVSGRARGTHSEEEAAGNDTWEQEPRRRQIAPIVWDPRLDADSSDTTQPSQQSKVPGGQKSTEAPDKAKGARRTPIATASSSQEWLPPPPPRNPSEAAARTASAHQRLPQKEVLSLPPHRVPDRLTKPASLSQREIASVPVKHPLGKPPAQTKKPKTPIRWCPPPSIAAEEDSEAAHQQASEQAEQDASELLDAASPSKQFKADSHFKKQQEPRIAGTEAVQLPCSQPVQFSSPTFHQGNGLKEPEQEVKPPTPPAKHAAEQIKGENQQESKGSDPEKAKTSKTPVREALSSVDKIGHEKENDDFNFGADFVAF